MGFLSRLRNGVANAVRSPVYESPINREIPRMDLNAVKFAMGGMSQPVWGPEVSTVGAYSREGYTSKTFTIPRIPFTTQRNALIEDEDAQLAINHLSSQITGAAHYWKSTNESVMKYIDDFSSALEFDIMDTELVKELLWYGNSVYKARDGIANVRTADDLMHIPISSFVRIWWDRDRRPYKYEFRGAEYQGYHNPDDIIHFMYNPIDANSYGQGFAVALTISRLFNRITPDGEETKSLPSLLDLKLSTKFSMHLIERRYIPRNAYLVPNANQEERTQLNADLRKLEEGEDFVFGVPGADVKELGSAARAFNPTQFTDLTQGAIFKALNDFSGKQGSESSHQYANAKTSELLNEIGLSSFPLAVSRQLMAKLFKPWYEANPIYSPEFNGGIVSMSWKDCEYELNFGELEKKDLPTEEYTKLLEIATQTGAVQDPLEIRDLLERAGLPLSKEQTDLMNQQYNDLTGQMAMNQMNIPQDTQMSDPNWDYNIGTPPEEDPAFNTGARDMMYNPRPTDAHLNFTYTKKNHMISRKPIR